MIKKDNKLLYLECLNPKLAISSIIKERPKRLIFASGTLPPKDVC